jgi:hypothetical protein
MRGMGKRVLAVLSGAFVVACATAPPPAPTAAAGNVADSAADAAPVADADADAVPDVAPAPPPGNVHGVATLTTYLRCGGAKPRPEDPVSSVSPGAGHTLYFRRSGSRKNVATVTTDANGAFGLDLPRGEYCVIDALKADDKTPASAWTDDACLRAYRVACDLVFSAPSGGALAVPLTKSCLPPCYHGPMPP